MNPALRPAVARPASAAYFIPNVLALAVGIGVILALEQNALPGWLVSIPYRALLPCAAIMLVIATSEWLQRRRRGAELPSFAATALRPLSWRRIGLRLWGFAATLLLLGLAYALFSEYSGSFYFPYWLFLESLAPLLALVPFYFMFADAYARDPEDEYVQFGRMLCGRWHSMDRSILKRHLLGWLVKGYFLPLMAVYLSSDLDLVLGLVRQHGLGALTRYDVWFQLAYTIDLLFCVIGYTASTRLLDSHMRSVEPTMLGWVVALICYQPFYSVIGRFYLQYEGRLFWDTWLGPWPMVRTAWGAAIIVLSLTYSLSTVAFGLRFSNLTHRGIITGGPYRFSKHPAYLSKNLSWWLISVPFVVANDVPTTLRHCAALLLLNGIYWLRARTEERHLSRDPVYVNYALWMNDNGILRTLGRWCPLLRFKAPAGGAPAVSTSP
ncbi:MAG: hypothetical protein WA825_13285 [Steroidobacteraceae bacterium]